MWRVGKKLAGALLGGHLCHDFPDPQRELIAALKHASN
jgi:hypothetical protein